MQQNKENTYNRNVQKELLSYMISDGELYTRCQNILKSKYFDNQLKTTMQYILDYADEYNTMPTVAQVDAYCNVELSQKDLKDCKRQADWFLKTIESFCRHKAMEILLLDGADLVQKESYGDIERICKENMMISLQKDLGTDYFANPLERLEKMKNRTDMTSTGWKSIDKVLFGGTNRGELTIWCGLPGHGKSLILQNQAINWMQQGKNVLYITLELAEELVGLRWDAMLTEQTTKAVFGAMSEVAARLGMLKIKHKDQWGKLVIKKLPEGGTTVNDIRAFMKEYEIQTGMKFDAICVDYLDLLYPSSGKIDVNNIFLKDKMTTEELRALSQEFGLLAATAAQIGRAGVQETDFDISHISGGISKLNTADNVMALFAPPALKAEGEFQIQFIKTRSSSGNGAKINLSYNCDSLRITDLDLVLDDTVVEKATTERVIKESDNIPSEAPKQSSSKIIASRLNKLKKQ